MQKDSVDRMIETWADTHPDLDVSPLEVVGRLLLCAHHLQRALVEELQPLGLTFADFDVLNTLRRQAEPTGANPSVLAESALITTGAMTSRLHRLETAGLVRKVPDAEDGRSVRVSLTPRGRRLAVRALTKVLAVDENFLAPLTNAQRRQVAGALRQVLVEFEE
ncbi:MarR family winged helix-turn-helix transcriptional regulator [Kribbella sp. CA-293567]|uniref:MarR family winged helix-turn-helix transcriptional regulator n=1 Tax=Kribbella sp. CA-293567 TaxID=3002436 RepID=UPI0022DDD847|nr:MarR family transcriptional regulator [Kribbella sp. CA-293567]WBQ04371.1 MarR family transcriptional regulator [Kribbella sp. CA-293567]